jgi:class 3 adenylate cyclase
VGTLGRSTGVRRQTLTGLVVRRHSLGDWGATVPTGRLWLSNVVALTEEEVARRSGVTEQRVRELKELGIFARSSEANATFSPGDILRVQLVDELESSGVPAAEVAAAIAAGALSLAYLDRVPDPPARSSRTYADLCADLGVPFQLLERIFSAFGLPRPGRDDPVREDDLAVISKLPIMFTAGLGEAEMLRAARVWSEGVRRVAQHQVHSFHELIEEPFRRRGLSDDQALDAALSEIGPRLLPFVNQLVTWLYGRHFERSATEHRLAHVEAALDAAGLHRKPAPHPDACVFADLTGSTRLTEEHGDTAAADMALRLAEVMQEVADRHGGLVVKMLGDGVHFHFPEPANAVLGALDLVDMAELHGLPPAHVGVNAGPITYTDGDYYGLTVIIGARIAEAAGPTEVLVGETARRYADPDGVRFVDVGPVQMKGVARPVRVYRALRAHR